MVSERTQTAEPLIAVINRAKSAEPQELSDRAASVRSLRDEWRRLRFHRGSHTVTFATRPRSISQSHLASVPFSKATEIGPRTTRSAARISAAWVATIAV